MMQQDGEILTAHKLKSTKNKVSDYTKKIVKNDRVGEIIQVQGGQIIKATGRKDRHSKVYTAKGPRDRRVRLSANTAIQFYDVQDRLGYDRPSKAIDWLMKKAKVAIDKLEDSTNQDEIKRDQSCSTIDFNSGCSRSVQEFHLQKHESIADSMKSFFPLSPGTSLMEMENYPHERVSRIGIQSEDLGLLLNTQNQDQLLLQGSNSVQQFEQNYSNLVGEGENRVGFVFNPHTIPQQLFGSQNSGVFSQREPLQSNYSQNLLHSWNERMLPSLDQQIINGQPTLQPCLYNFYFGSNFQGPDQIHGQQEHSQI